MDARFLSFTSLMFFATLTHPSSIQRIDFRAIDTDQKISISRNSPAYAALEDSRAEYIEYKNVLPKIALQLKFKKTNKIDEGARGGVYISQVTTQPKADYLANLVSEMNNENEIYAPTMVETAEVLVAEELRRKSGAETSGIKEIPTESGASIIVYGTPPSLPKGQPLERKLVKSPAPEPKRKIAWQPPVIKKPDFASLDMASAKTTGNAKNAMINTMNKEIPSKYIISGPITFAGGAAFLGGRDEILARHIVSGLTYSTGHVNQREGEFEISTDNLEGEVVAEVRNRDGQLIAAGRASLNRLTEYEKGNARIKNVSLTVRPVYNGASINVVSASSYGKNIFAVTDAKLYLADLEREIRRDDSGNYQDDALVMPSNYIVKAFRPNFWPTIAFARSGERAELRVFPSSLIEAFLNLTLDKYLARDAIGAGIIWGRVTYAGQPIEGAQVEIIGESDRRATYFDGFLPDKTRTSTAMRGEFAFSRLKDEAQALRITMGGKQFWPVLLPVESRHVCYAELEIQPSRKIEVKSYDAFSLEAVPAVIQPLGSDFEYDVTETGHATIIADTTQGLTFVETQSLIDYSSTRVALQPEQSEILLPQIKKDWVANTIRKSIADESELKKVLLQPTVIGFIAGDDYDVFLGAGDEFTQKNIIYFNEKGEVVKDHGVAGGGYIIINAPTGLNTVTIVPAHSKKIVTQVVYADEYAINVLQTNLMY
jgi:hypothetical protein